MKYPGDITPEAYAAMEEGYDQGRAEGRQELAEDTRLAAEVRAACDAVGIPHDVDGLIRHHRGNAGLAAAFDAMTEGAVLRTALTGLAQRWEALSEQDPYDPGNPGGYAAELRAVLAEESGVESG